MSKIITFWSVDGGTGKTTISTNVALKTALMYPKKKVLLIDFNLINSDIPTLLSLKTNNLQELYEDVVREGVQFKTIENQIVYHPRIRNFGVIGGLTDIHFVDKFNLNIFNQVLLHVRELGFDYIFIDVNGMLSIDATFASLVNSDKTVILAECLYPSVLNMIRYKEDALSKIDITEKNSITVINKYDVRLISQQELQKILNTPKFYCVDFNLSIMQSVNEGNPFVLEKKRELKKVLKTLETLVVELCEESQISSVEEGI